MVCILSFYLFMHSCFWRTKNRPPDLEVHFYLSGQPASSMFAGLISNLKFSIFKAAFTLLQQICRSIRTACGLPSRASFIFCVIGSNEYNSRFLSSYESGSKGCREGRIESLYHHGFRKFLLDLLCRGRISRYLQGIKSIKIYRIGNIDKNFPL